MKFVSTDRLKPGMRLAKPIYNENGVLLYDRDTKLTSPGIKSIENFRLIGVYVLEPAEPLPPLSTEDLDFERNQTMYLFRLQDIFGEILQGKKPDGLSELVNDIRRKYGALDHRVNFNQNIRSAKDFIYKHGISVAILTAMITSRMTMTGRFKDALVCAALLYDIGYKDVPQNILEKGDHLDAGDKDIIQNFLEKDFQLLTPFESSFDFYGPALDIMRYYIFSRNPNSNLRPNKELEHVSSVLRVANKFDRMTAMNLGYEPESELVAMKHLLRHPELYPAKIVRLLTECIHIVPGAACVDLSTGDRAIVLMENPEDFLHPVILRLSDNQVYDLSIPSVAVKLQVTDIMKTMDNRVHMDEDTLKQFVPDENLKKIFEKRRQKSKSE